MGALRIEDLNYTYDDYITWEGDWELIDGVPIPRGGAVSMSPAPMIKHQSISTRIATLLSNGIEDCDKCLVASEVDYKVNNDTVLRPDVVLICDEPNEVYLTKAPELIVEVISKSTAKRDEQYKFKIYEKEKVNYYILIYPNELIAKIYKLRNGKYDNEGDFFKQTYKFKNITCMPEIDFKILFKKFQINKDK